MAYELNYTSDTGSTHSESYWIPTDINYRKIEQIVEIVFRGYVDQSARDSEKSPIGARDFICRDTDFTTYFDDIVLAQDGKDLIGQCYAYVDGQTEDTFFDNATDV